MIEEREIEESSIGSTPPIRWKRQSLPQTIFRNACGGPSLKAGYLCQTDRIGSRRCGHRFQLFGPENIRHRRQCEKPQRAVHRRPSTNPPHLIPLWKSPAIKLPRRSKIRSLLSWSPSAKSRFNVKKFTVMCSTALAVPDSGSFISGKRRYLAMWKLLNVL